MYNITYAIKAVIVFSLTALSFIFMPASCFASWFNTPGIYDSSTGKVSCPVTPDTPVNVTSEDYTVASCELAIGDGNKVPESGSYRIVLAVVDSNQVYYTSVRTDSGVYISAGVELNTMNVGWQISQYRFGNPGNHICYLLRSDTNKYYSFNNTPQSCPEGSGGSTPLPSPFQCAFGDGSTLNISLGDVDRTEIGAVPGTLPGTEKNINITCTGDGSATYTIGFQYTAIDIAGTEMISSSANGLAVAMSLNDELVNPTDTYTRTYSTGTQTEKLTFEPVRDPSVKIGDIPTGAFSASAVMVLTLQ